MRRKHLAVLAAIMFLVVGAVLAGQAEAGRRVSWADVRTFQNPDGTSIPPEEREVVGHAKLVRSSNGPMIEIKTTELGEDVAYTVWWIIFNNPEECDDDGCNASDFGNPKVEASVVYATGRMTDAEWEGKGTFRAFLPVGLNRLNRTAAGRERQRFGPSLQNPWKAEIHFIIRCHGPINDDDTAADILEKISTVNGGCPGGIGCFDAQAGAFPLPRGHHNHD
jgi:hypothetical protein